MIIEKERAEMMKANKSIQIVMMVSVVLVLCGSSFGEMSRYRIIDLGTLDCYGRVWEINDNGQVAGGYQPGGSIHAVVWDSVNGKIDLGFLVGGGGSRANHINNSGYAVGGAGTGTYPNGQKYKHAFLWDNTNGMVDLGSLFINDWSDSEAFGINDAGQVVGKSMTAQGWRAFLWDSTNGMVDLGTMGDDSCAYGINNNGQVVGCCGVNSGVEHAFLWDSTNGMVDIGTLGGEDSIAHAINDSGQVVGESHVTGVSPYHGFIWDDENGMVDLGTLGGNNSVAEAINNNGQVVGHSDTVVPSETHAFLWDSNNGMVDLNTLLVGQSNFDYLSYATGINNQGQIVGFGGVSGETHAFVMIPVTTYHVDGTGGSDSNDGLSYETAFATIQFAIDEANDGDVVIVADGTYVENINFNAKNIMVTSSNGAAKTIIDGNENGSVVIFENAENSASLSGFTIKNGNGNYVNLGNSSYWTYYGGGVFCNNNANINLNNLIIKGNSSIQGGAVFGNSHTTVNIENCQITYNSYGWGGTVHTYGEVNIHSTNISNNQQTTFFEFNGCAIYMISARASITNTTITDNDGIGLYNRYSDVSIRNSILWNNSYTQIELYGGNSSLTTTLDVDYSDIMGGPDGVTYSNWDSSPPILNFVWGDLNIDADPCFANPGSNDFHLLPDSPCIDAGDNNAVPIDIVTDLDGNPRFFDDIFTIDTGNGTAPIVDMGAYEFGCATCVGDLDANSVVNLADLNQLVGDLTMAKIDSGQWKITKTLNPTYWKNCSDMDADGDIDLADLNRMVGNLTWEKIMADNWYYPCGTYDP